MSRDELDAPLHGVAIYNPRLLSREELVATFVARGPLLSRLVEDIRAAPADAAPQHRLLLGQRGMGKTMLLHRLAVAVQDDDELARRWLPLTFPEEQYNVSRLADLWLNCIDALGDALERAGDVERAAWLDERVAELTALSRAEMATRALACLKQAAATLGRRFLLLFDNFDLILERLVGDHWAVREVLSSEPWMLVVGASARVIEATYEYDAAFYEFFAVDELRGLSAEEMRALLLKLSERAGNDKVRRYVHEQPARLRSLQVLTGGNPRTIVLLYEVLAEGVEGSLRTDLDRLLDRCTPLYKARFEALAPQAQHVVDGLAVHWDPIGTGELATLVRLGNRVVSTQLDRLTRAGIVEKVPLIAHGTTRRRKKSGYQLAERFFNIWYLMRASRRVRRKLVWLVKFLEIVHTPDELRLRAMGHLRGRLAPERRERMRYAECGLALAQVVCEEPLRGALEHSGLQALTGDTALRARMREYVVLDGEDAAYRPVVERLLLIARTEETVRAARVEWGERGAEEYWDLLGGALCLSWEEKCRIADALEAISDRQRGHLLKALHEERRGLARRLADPALAETYAAAVRSGVVIPGESSEAAPAHPGDASAPIAAVRKRVLAAEVEWGEHSAHGFWELLRDSVSLSWEEKAKLADRLPELPAGQRERLIDIFREERQKLAALTREHEATHPFSSTGRIARIDLERAARAALLFDEPALYAAALADAAAAERSPARRDELLARAMETAPDHPYPHIVRGNVLRDASPREAEAAYRRALEVAPDHGPTWLRLASALGPQQRHGEAEAAIHRAIAVDSRDVAAWIGLGNLLSDHLDQPEAGERAYRRAIDLEPTFKQAWYNLGLLLRQDLHRQDEAEQAYRRALELDPSYTNAQNNLAWLLFCTRGPGEEALELARAAFRRSPDKHSAHTLACILVASGRWHEAVEPATRFLESGDEAYFDHNWTDVVRLFRDAARTGHAAAAVELLDASALGERWRPLREALVAVAAGGVEALGAVAPEVRQPAEILYTQLTATSEVAEDGAAKD